jgi:hypothetical protein
MYSNHITHAMVTEQMRDATRPRLRFRKGRKLAA